MEKYQTIASFLLRLALAVGFLSSVASHSGLWGQQSLGWENFLNYTAEVNSFAPVSFVPFFAIATTMPETDGLFIADRSENEIHRNRKKYFNLSVCLGDVVVIRR